MKGDARKIGEIFQAENLCSANDITAALAEVGLADWGDTSVKKFSKGMLQRVQFVGSLLHAPELLKMTSDSPQIVKP